MLYVKNVTDPYIRRVPHWEGKDFVFDTGVTALVGSNGSGKSTLITILDQKAQGGVGLADVSSDHELEFYSPVSARSGGTGTITSKVDIARIVQSSGQFMQNWTKTVTRLPKNSIIVLDEPENHLDLTARRDFITRLKAHEFAFVIMATHDPLLIAEADHVVSVDADPDYVNKTMNAWRAWFNEVM